MKVTDHYEGLRFNTGISQLMVFINEAYKATELPKEYMEGFVKLLSPVAPHLAEELWEKLGHSGTIAYEAWPVYDETKLVDDEVEIVVQLNGKVKAKLQVMPMQQKNSWNSLLKQMKRSKSSLKAKRFGKSSRSYGKLVNIVAN